MDEEKKTGTRSTPNLDRRKILKATGAGITTFGLSTTASAVENPGILVSNYRSRNRPISSDEVRSIQQTVARRFRDETGASSAVPVGGPRVVDGTKLVSYSVKVYPNGQSQYYAGFVKENASEAEKRQAHNHTQAFENVVRNARRPQNYRAKIGRGERR